MLTEVFMGTSIRRWSLAIGAAVLGVAVLAAPANAQTGQIRGKVVDADNKPVEGATVTIVETDGGANRKYVVKTKKGGDYIQIGIAPGNYRVTAEKDKLTETRPVRIGLDMSEVNLTLKPGGAAAGGEMTKEAAAKNAARVAAIKAKFAEGGTLSSAGQYDEAIAKFNEVLVEVPKCPECYLNIGSVNTQKKDYDKAEEAYKKALELDPESVDAYNGLANIYNSQKKFKEAQAMSAEAGKRAGAAPGGASAESLYNQGVIAWNANDAAKAGEHFAAAVAANPNHAESHFMLGRSYLNLGKLAEAAKEFEAYVKIAPAGPNAKEAQSNFEMLKQYIK
jgi:tetratricopeptide (TPR) repeat protein